MCLAVVHVFGHVAERQAFTLRDTTFGGFGFVLGPLCFQAHFALFGEV